MTKSLLEGAAFAAGFYAAATLLYRLVGPLVEVMGFGLAIGGLVGVVVGMVLMARWGTDEFRRALRWRVEANDTLNAAAAARRHASELLCRAEASTNIVAALLDPVNIRVTAVLAKHEQAIAAANERHPDPALQDVLDSLRSVRKRPPQNVN